MEYSMKYKNYLKGLKGSLSNLKEASDSGSVKLSAKEEFDYKFKKELAKIVTNYHENVITSKFKYAMDNKKVLARFYARSLVELMKIADDYNMSKVEKYFKGIIKMAVSDYVCHEKFSVVVHESNNTYIVDLRKGKEVCASYIIYDVTSLLDSASCLIGYIGSKDEMNEELAVFLKYYITFEVNCIKNGRTIAPYVQLNNEAKTLGSFMKEEKEEERVESNIISMRA